VLPEFHSRATAGSGVRSGAAVVQRECKTPARHVPCATNARRRQICARQLQRAPQRGAHRAQADSQHAQSACQRQHVCTTHVPTYADTILRAPQSSAQRGTASYEITVVAAIYVQSFRGSHGAKFGRHSLKRLEQEDCVHEKISGQVLTPLLHLGPMDQTYYCANSAATLQRHHVRFS